MMAFTYTAKTIYPGGRIAAGTYTCSGGATGGDINTGLPNVMSFTLTPQGTSVSANQSVYNETLPLANGVVTIVTTANEVGSWTAVADI
jgi:hypothetical protein